MELEKCELQKLVVQRHPRVDPDKSSEMSRMLKISKHLLQTEGTNWFTNFVTQNVISPNLSPISFTLI